MRTRAILSRGSAPSELVEVDLDEPRDDEVLVQIEAVGVCHTDLVTRGMLGERPAVLGHEGCGRVLQVGSAVTQVRAGDRVIIGYARCGSCAQCRAGRPAYCDRAVALNGRGTRGDGSATIRVGGEPVFGSFFGQSSWAEVALAPASSCVVVEDMPAHLAAPLGCGTLTGAGAVLEVLRPRPGDRLLVVGAGGVGASAVLAALGEGVEVAVAEPLAARRDLLTSLGARAVGSVDEAGGEYTHVLDTTGRPDVIAAGIGALARLGTLCLVGLGPREATLDVDTVLRRGLTVRGCLEGDADPQDLVPELVARWRKGRLPLERIVATYPLAQVDRAIAEQAQGLVTKAVLLPEQ